jgi:hemerythrin
MSERDADEAMALVQTIGSLLVGKDPDVQGAALADLLAMWLAGHVQLGDPEQTKRMREKLLEMHIEAVKALIDINYQISVEPQIKRRTQ